VWLFRNVSVDFIKPITAEAFWPQSAPDHDRKEVALGVFLDIDEVFDNASFGSMDAASMGLF
jgi:hypothetical protein